MNNMTTEDKVSYAVTEIVKSLKMARAGLRYILMVDETADVEKIAFLFSQCTDSLLEMEHISYSGEYDNGLVTRDYFEKIVQDKFADWEKTKKKADEDWLNFLKENDNEAYTRRMKIVAMRDECDKMRERVSKANKEELPGLLCEYREMLNKTRKYIDGETDDENKSDAIDEEIERALEYAETD
jgi:hypothetical protein